MALEPKTVLLGAHLTMCLVGIGLNVWWRHYSRYLRLVFPKSVKSERKLAVRLFFGFWLVASVGNFVYAVIKNSFTLENIGAGVLFALGVSAIFFVMDAIISRIGR